MMMMNTALAAITAVTAITITVGTFDNYIKRNYNQLRSEAQRICYNDASFEDILNDNLIKVRTRIVKSGMTITKYLNNIDRTLVSYLWRGISNDYKLLKKRQGRRDVYDINNPNLVNSINNFYLLNEHDKESFYRQNEIVCQYLFKYLNQNYNEKQCQLFKIYFLTSCNTYEKLAIQTDYNRNYVKNTINKMKKDLNNNLINYIKDQVQYHPDQE